MKSFRLLDICCGAGGASRGYTDAGFSCVGVDIDPQPNYPYEFIQMDAQKLDYEFLDQFDIIHASPPCQEYSRGGAVARKRGKKYPDLINPIRQLLIASGKPYIMENVVGAPLRVDVMLCGTMFGLSVLRHRYFETNLPLTCDLECRHEGMVKTGEYVTVAGNGGGGSKKLSAWAAAMDIDWMTRSEIKEAIPPAYTWYLGKQAEALLISGDYKIKSGLNLGRRLQNPLPATPRIHYPVRLPGF